MSPITQIHVNSEKHSGAVDILQNPTSKDVASFAAKTGFNKVKTHAVGEGTLPYQAQGHVVIQPQLFPQVTCHAIFYDDKTEITNTTPVGNVRIIFDNAKPSFVIENQHDGVLDVKHTAPAQDSLKDETAYLGTFNGAQSLEKGDAQTYPADGHYAIRSKLDPNPANVFAIDFISGKIYMTNGNPAGEIAITLQKA